MNSKKYSVFGSNLTWNHTAIRICNALRTTIPDVLGGGEFSTRLVALQSNQSSAGHQKVGSHLVSDTHHTSISRSEIEI